MIQMGKKPKTYVVFRGKVKGIYNSWEACEAQVKGFPDADHKAYKSLEEAQRAWEKRFGAGVVREDYSKHTVPKLKEMIDGRGISRTGCTLKAHFITVLEAHDKDPTSNAPMKQITAPPKSTVSYPELNSQPDSHFPPTNTSYTKPSHEDFGRTGTLKRSSSALDHTDPGDDPQPAAKKRKPRKPKTNKKEEEEERGEQLDSGEIPIILTDAQQAVVAMALRGDNIFLTGAAGSGKTATLKEILRCLEIRFPSKNKEYPTVQVTAPTGIAALPLKGKTTWSFAGWTPSSFTKPMEELLQNCKPTNEQSWRQLKVLVIEEISMVENQFLERLDMLLKSVLKNELPFGGIQVIFVGDFHQLPPVKPFEYCLICGEPMSKGTEGPLCKSLSCPLRPDKETIKWADKWVFKSAVWAKLNLKHVKLEQIHRQKDANFQSMLNKIRNGITLDDSEWKELEKPKILPQGITAVRLMSLVNQVRNFNESKLAAINKAPKSWKAIDLSRKMTWTEEDKMFRRPEIARKEHEYLMSLKDHRFPADLTLKVGAKVVLLYNLDIKTGLVNGTQGEVMGFVDTKSWPAKKVEGENNKWRDERVDEFEAENSWRPIVRFANGLTKAIPPIASESLRGPRMDRYIVCRTQIPLTLAWALSIHKSQGMTLEYVEVNSRDIFETGQLYVGLSRATKLEGLTVTGFNRKVLDMDPDVLEFYRSSSWVDLGTINSAKSIFDGVKKLSVKDEPKSDVGNIGKF